MRTFVPAASVLGAVLALFSTAEAFDEPVPGKVFVAKPEGNLVKAVAKAPKGGPSFPLPSGDPGAGIATLRVFDDGGAGGDDTYALGAGTWKGLGTPPGSKGWKYKGAGTAADPCKTVVIKEKVVKAVCKDKGAGGMTLTTPFSGAAVAVLSIGDDRYCGQWGGTTKRNDEKAIKRKDAPSPSSCPNGPSAAMCCEIGPDCGAPVDSATCIDVYGGTPVAGDVVCDATGKCVSPPGVAGCCGEFGGTACGASALDQAACEANCSLNPNCTVVFGNVCHLDGMCY